MLIGHDDRAGRNNGGHLEGTRPRVSFKTHRPNRELSRNAVLASLDEDIPMTGNNNNNRQTRQVIIASRDRDRRDRMWQRTITRGRNSPLPNRNFKGGQSGPRIQALPIGESNWYRISVSMIVLLRYNICNYLYIKI